MSIEAGLDGFVPRSGTLAAACIAEWQNTLAHSLVKIGHCLRQLPDSELGWRPHEGHNSIQNIILHLCGNLRQWVVHGIHEAPDDRNRAAEFADRTPRTKEELLSLLTDAVHESIEALQALDDDDLLARRRIQGFETTVLAAAFESVSHFVGHAHQIVYITRLRLGNAYEFQWTPGSGQGG